MAKHKAYRYLNLDKATRLDVLRRDNFRCIVCGAQPVEVHEIVPRSAFGSKNKDRCFVVKNRITLCREHHSTAHAYAERIKMLKYLSDKYNYTYTEEEYKRYGDYQNG